MKLTVIFRDDGSMVCCGDCPSYRSMAIELTEEQKAAIKPRFTFHQNGHVYVEVISKCFLEDEG